MRARSRVYWPASPDRADSSTASAIFFSPHIPEDEFVVLGLSASWSLHHGRFAKQWHFHSVGRHSPHLLRRWAVVAESQVRLRRRAGPLLSACSSASRPSLKLELTRDRTSGSGVGRRGSTALHTIPGRAGPRVGRPFHRPRAGTYTRSCCSCLFTRRCETMC